MLPLAELVHIYVWNENNLTNSSAIAKPYDLNPKNLENYHLSCIYSNNESIQKLSVPKRTSPKITKRKTLYFFIKLVKKLNKNKGLLQAIGTYMEQAI